MKTFGNLINQNGGSSALRGTTSYYKLSMHPMEPIKGKKKHKHNKQKKRKR
jgi:hypothetical protein